MGEEKQELEKQVNELKAKCDAIEKREAERRAIEEKKHAEEIQFLKRTNQQLKVSECNYMCVCVCVYSFRYLFVCTFACRVASLGHHLDLF